MKKFDCIGVGRHQNITDLKNKSLEEILEFITESGLLEIIYFYKRSK